MEIGSEEKINSNNATTYLNHSITDLPSPLISDILEFLQPKELAIVCCVSPLLNRLASENRVWKEAYCERWSSPSDASNRSWKDLYVEREFRSRTFLGKYRVETLLGHTEAVRAVFLMASANLIFTSGYDSVVKMWNCECGLLIGSSKSLNCTIRAIAADSKLLVVGGTDGFIQGWRRVENLPHLFDLSELGFRVWEHEGPISSLALDSARIYSGSWDMTVRIWDRSSLVCLEVLVHNDWVWAVAPHFSIVATSSGPDLHLWSSEDGALVGSIQGAHKGNTYALAMSHTGNYVFTGGEDGAIQMYEIVARGEEKMNLSKIAYWIPHTGAVNSLGFEFPWLVSASGDGRLSLIDVRNLVKERRRWGRGAEAPQRMLHGFGPNLFSVAIGADRVICGGEGGAVRMWDFSESLEGERRAMALRSLRMERRMARKNNRAEYCSLAARLSPERDASQKREICGRLRA